MAASARSGKYTGSNALPVDEWLVLVSFSFRPWACHRFLQMDALSGARGGIRFCRGRTEVDQSVVGRLRTCGTPSDQKAILWRVFRQSESLRLVSHHLERSFQQELSDARWQIPSRFRRGSFICLVKIFLFSPKAGTCLRTETGAARRTRRSRRLFKAVCEGGYPTPIFSSTLHNSASPGTRASDFLSRHAS